MDVRYLTIGILLAAFPGRQMAQEAKGFDTDSFHVAVTFMMPVSYPARTLSYGYELSLRNDTAFVYLPYMGRVYQPVMYDDGLRFALPASDVKTRSADGKWQRVEFSVRKNPVSYKFTVTGYDNGRADIILIPSNAQGISYGGYWDEGD